MRDDPRLVTALFAALLGLHTPCYADSTIVFNEIMYHPAASEATLEWVELHSQMGVDMDISGWSIRGGIEFTFPEGTTVEGGGLVVVAITPVAMAAESGFADALGPFAGRLGNDGDRLELRSNSDRLMDWVEYGDDDDWPPGADGSGVSLAKVDPDTASPPPDNWRTSLETGGTPGRHNFGSPAGPTQVELLPIGAPWKYSASGVDLGTSWSATAFDDSAWSTADGLFHRATGDGSVTWVGNNNRTQPQDFGFSPSTNNARGASLGEIGGYLERFPAAWYADTDIGTFDLATDDLSASVTWLQNGLGNATFGYLQAASYGLGTDPVGLYWQIDDLNLYLAVVRAGVSTKELVGSLSVDVPSAITMRWTAATRTWTVTLDGGPSQSAVVPDLTGLTLDRFGVFSLGFSASQGVTFWADDIEYTVGAPISTQRFVDGEGSPIGSRTELPVGPTTYYFRTTFEFNGDPDTAKLFLQPVVDDGVVLYLNGAEVYRDNLPPGAIGYSIYASSDVRLAAARIPVSLPIDNLRSGTNVLAVEVHQSSAGDDDMAFGASLVSHIEPPESEPPLALVINEVSSTLEPDFWAELFNAAATAVDLTDYVLIHAGETGGEYVFPSQTIPAGGYLLLTEATLSFDVADDDKIFLLAPDRDVLLDAAVVKDAPRARYLGSNKRWLFPSAPTPGAANTFALNDAIVINEIMYHQRPVPASLQSPTATPYPESPEAWIELYNRGDEAIDLTGWKLTDAVEFEFEPDTVMAPGEYLVVAKNRAYLQAVYPALAIAGEYAKNLSFRSDSVLLTDDRGNPADRVRYFDRGHWHELANGGGSSLELQDPRADNARPEAWRASDESGRAGLNLYSNRGVATSVIPGEPTGARGFQIGFLDGAGEILLDDVSVIRDPDGDAIELISNGRFDGGSIEGWTFGGTHRDSHVTVDPEATDNHVLRLVGVGPTEPIFNNAFTGLADAVPDGAEYEISFRARWLAGSNQINTRLSYNRLPKTTLVEVPERSGTPGMPNSRSVANIGPTFEGLSHRPVTPSAGQPVTVSVRATDPDGISSATLWWSAGERGWNSAGMSLQPNGRYAASIPGQDAAAIVQFYIEARDGQSATAFSPSAGPDSRALYAVYDGQAIAGAVHNFRTIMLPSESAYLHDGENVRSNERLGGTVVWKERQQYYDVGVRLRGSLRPGRSEPTVGHNISFQPDRLFRGVHSTVSIDRDAHSVLGVKEIVLLHAITHAGSMPGMYNDIVQAIAPLPAYTNRAILRMAAQGDAFLDSQFDNGSDGTIYESDVLRIDETNFVEFMDLGDDKEFYRWNFAIQNNRTRDDYSGLIALSKTLGMNAGAALEARAAEVMDVSQWMRVFAMQALGGVSDTYLHDGNHNLRVYQARPMAACWPSHGTWTARSRSRRSHGVRATSPR